MCRVEVEDWNWRQSMEYLIFKMSIDLVEKGTAVQKGIEFQNVKKNANAVQLAVNVVCHDGGFIGDAVQQKRRNQVE